jgi:dienelactone hydrolase
MRSARFITSEGEGGVMTTLGVVLAGVAAGATSTIERYTARGYNVRIADIDEAMSIDDALERVRLAMAELSGGKVAVVGYGAGGRYAFLAVTRLGADAAAVFHGSGIGDHLAESAFAKMPLTFHFGDDDDHVPFAEVRTIKGALEGFGTTEIYRYPGARDGFALRDDPNYDEASALAAERRVFAVLDRLGQFA